MPIIVKEFTWKQTPGAVSVRIPLSAVRREKVDLFATDSYVKAHYSPFLLELFLYRDVDIDRSRCVVQDELIVLDLVKREEQEWDQLEKVLTRAEKMQLRQEILEKSQEIAKEESEQRRIRKSQMDRFTVQKAMEIDSKDHELMDSRRDAQRKLAMDALEEWRVGADARDSSGVKIVELPDDKKAAAEIVELQDDTQHEEKKADVSPEKLPPNDAGVSMTVDAKKVAEPAGKAHQAKPISPQPAKTRPRKPVKTPVRSEYVEKKRAEAARRALPAVRAPRSLEVQHSARVFPTPSRQSARAEEEAWLRNITAARRATGFVSEDLRPEEQDPQWCKNKGDEFFRAGNFLGAVSAYSHGIKLSDRLPSLFANRAATHFALGNFNKCASDCSAALELLRPACAANRRSRAACVARRAAALARLGYLSKAIDEMKVAADMLPEDSSLRQDIYAMERAWEQNPDSD